ncbi:hypothetical protein CHGG_00260 [Chaetomium globosum CBS 148.51]|uniref:T6SS Phospholipase effector Tle1-like catalytic domain-containing protein n=1 Tax=Chaetomium globosum (strain ATCC 6205 / CBS 148.51 / DSM 1962 / NBRC 6347 / NRRL 1970) TaxID=306901 RepID=Q2HHP4_CHAGB|nr:uncharacterized protein CHGG_00260 [Chaetomium globosum CBS 148.51]EAQ92025.1 hypothetical protein CHGG_00260 [Chaetomium globosum CBS 148.51]
MESHKKSSPRRVLVLCFDGTGNTFRVDGAEANILKIFRMVDRTEDEQRSLCHLEIEQFAQDDGAADCVRLSQSLPGDHLPSVWFPGDHADIGGGWQPGDEEQWSLSHAPLVWMFGQGLPPASVLLWRVMEYLPLGRMHLQADGSWNLVHWPLPCGAVRDIPKEAEIHASEIR